MKIFRLCIISLLLIFFLSGQLQAQVTEWWESNRPETLYLTQMLLADSDRFIYEFQYPFLLVLSGNEKEEYSKITTQDDRKLYIRDYIKRNNENPLLPANYWLLEFLGRYEHARKEYSKDEPPYFDIRGEYYIKFGEPDSKYDEKSGHHQLGRGNAFYVRGSYMTFKVYPNESWSYFNDTNNFIVHFGKIGKEWKQVPKLEKLIQNYRISKKLNYWSSLIRNRDILGSHYTMLPDEINFKIEIDTDETAIEKLDRASKNARRFNRYAPPDKAPMDNPIYELMIQTEVMDMVNLSRAIPDVSTRFTKLSELVMDYNLTQFKNPDGRTRVELQLLAPIDDLLSKRRNVQIPEDLTVEFEFLGRNEKFDQLFRVPLSTTFNYKKAIDAGLSHAVSTVTFPAQAMNGDLTMQIKDPVSLKMGFKKVPLNVRNFSGDSLQVSDIQLYMQPQNEEQKELLPISAVGEFEVTPYPYSKVLNFMPMTCYFEIYNIMESGIYSEYDIDISVTRIELSMFEKFKRLIRNTENYTTGMKRTRKVEGNESSELIEFDISSLKKGNYLLEVIVTDKKNKKNSASASKRINIIGY